MHANERMHNQSSTLKGLKCVNVGKKFSYFSILKETRYEIEARDLLHIFSNIIFYI
jgi:hypothetical protein